MRKKVSQPYKTTGKIIVLYILIFMFQNTSILFHIPVVPSQISFLVSKFWRCEYHHPKQSWYRSEYIAFREGKKAFW